MLSDVYIMEEEKRDTAAAAKTLTKSRLILLGSATAMTWTAGVSHFQRVLIGNASVWYRLYPSSHTKRPSQHTRGGTMGQ
jgi:hypothetical protein